MDSIILLTILTICAGNYALVLAQCNDTCGSSEVQAVLAADFPDPALILADGSYYAFSTSGNGRNIQIATSRDFLDHSWGLLEEDALPDPGPWAKNADIWAPDVFELEDGRFVLYYSAPPLEDTSKHCVGAATSTNILGPYEPVPQPIACPLDAGGAIDPSVFLDPMSKRLYVVYKVDGNSLNTGNGSCGGPDENGTYHPTPLMLQEIDPEDGTTLLGDPVQILDRAEQDGPLVEAPNLFFNQETQLYFLTFSSNCYATDKYDISFAYSTCLDNQFVKSRYPLMTTASFGIEAPGGADMTPDGRFALFHATVGRDQKGSVIRHMFAAEADTIGIDMSALPLS